jgi:serine/threonine protein kinase
VALTSGTMVSHYRIIERIGAGGMGEVYLAEDTKLDRNVALKFLPSHLCQNSDCRARFTREAQASAKLDYPTRSNCTRTLTWSHCGIIHLVSNGSNREDEAPRSDDDRGHL